MILTNDLIDNRFGNGILFYYFKLVAKPIFAKQRKHTQATCFKGQVKWVMTFYHCPILFITASINNNKSISEKYEGEQIIWKRKLKLLFKKNKL